MLQPPVIEAQATAELRADPIRVAMQEVDSTIRERLSSRVALINQISNYIISAGGKRIRPRLVLLFAQALGFEGRERYELAAIVEFIHTATLLHDDVVDESDLRRGRATANAVWGNQPSVLVGDFLFSRAFQLMVADGSLRVLDILSNASAVIAEGEVLQLVTSNDTATSEQAYLDVISGKTAALFAAACQVGAVVADRPKVEEEALESYGRALGIAFQLIDDVLDYNAQQAKLGKTVGDDFREGKITLPVILAYRRGDAAEREFWVRCLERLEQTDADLPRAMELLEKHGALKDSVGRAEHYGAMARDALGIFADGPVKRALIELVDFCIHRAH